MLKTFIQILVLLSLLGCQSSVNQRPKNGSLQWKWAIESLEAFPFEKSDKVLDFGCRMAAITAKIASEADMVIGYEILEPKIAKDEVYDHASNIIYEQGEASKLPFMEQFDKAVALLVLNWIKEQDPVLKSLYTALKPGGKVLITRPGKQPSNLGPVAQVLIQKDQWAPYFPHFEQNKYYYDADEYAQILKNAGFVIDKISEDSTYTFFKDKKALFEFFKPLCTFTHHLSPNLQEQFVEEVVDVVIESNRTLPDGSILLHDFKLQVIASKPL